MRFLFLLLFVCTAAAPQKPSAERGQVPTQDPGQTLNRGRIGTQQSMPQGPLQWTGLLVDAGCQDRSGPKLAEKPGPTRTGNLDGSQEGRPPTDRNRSERKDAIQHQSEDHKARQQDPACAITGGTTAFALLLPDGLVLKLDEGGNTKAASALHGVPKAQKPDVTVKGRRRGDTLQVEAIRVISSSSPPAR